MPPIRSLSWTLAVMLLVSVAACNSDPVTWSDPRPLRLGSDSAAGAALSAARLAVDDSGAVVLAVAPAPAPPPAANACPGSVQIARGGVGEAREDLHAVWWEPRRGGSAALLATRSVDGGGTWSDPVPVDTMDRHGGGCDRPPPAITVDTITGYVHVAYFLDGPSGPGVFFSHSMERGTLFHAPVPIVYGERPARVAVASEGRLVAVAYEDPNSVGPRIGLRLSETDGHIFEHLVPPVSPSHGSATVPLVALRASRIAVAWESRPEATGGAFRLTADETAPTILVRTGDLQLGGS